MDVLVSSKLINDNELNDVVNSTFASVELDGPAILTDSALSLWTSLTRLRLTSNPSLAYGTCERVSHWLQTRWTAGG